MVPTPRVPIQSTPSIRPLHVTTSMGPRPWNLFSGTLHGTPSIEHPPCEPLHRITSRELPARDPLLRTPAWDPLKGTPYKGPLHKSHSTGPIQVTRPCGRLQGPLPEEPRGLQPRYHLQNTTTRELSKGPHPGDPLGDPGGTVNTFLGTINRGSPQVTP
jgi:hypothetical protein